MNRKIIASLMFLASVTTVLSAQNTVSGTPEIVNQEQKAMSAQEKKDEYLKRLSDDGKIVSYAFRFEEGKSVLLPGAEEEIRIIGELLLENSDICLDVQCYTDNSASDQESDILTQERAEAIKTAINDCGIEDARIMATGKGALDPIAPNDTEEGRKKNIRTELVKL